MLEVINPANNQVVNCYDYYTELEVGKIINLVDSAGKTWREIPFQEKSTLFLALADKLNERKGELADLMNTEMGKSLNEGVGEVEKCALLCRYYAENAEQFLQSKNIDTENSESYVSYEPLGIVFAIMPWNFPLWQVFRFAVPTLFAGNTAILKHASNVPGCSLVIEELFEQAGFPANVFRSVLITNDRAESLINHKYIKAVSFTGSTVAGKVIAREAGEALKKCVLELGGSDAYLILEDANLEDAAKVCAQSRLLNSGQSCISAKRFIVVEEVYDQFLDLFKKEMSNFGNEGLAPLARLDLRDELHKQVEKSISKGATAIIGGEIPEGDGAFYPPTILTNVAEGMPAYEDELFGPVASVIKVKDEEEAIDVANDSTYGLGAAVFTENVEKGKKIAEKNLNAGSCFVNKMVVSDPRLPFGGINQSGYGRELSEIGITEFVNIKTVVVK